MCVCVCVCLCKCVSVCVWPHMDVICVNILYKRWRVCVQASLLVIYFCLGSKNTVSIVRVSVCVSVFHDSILLTGCLIMSSLGLNAGCLLNNKQDWTHSSFSPLSVLGSWEDCHSAQAEALTWAGANGLRSGVGKGWHEGVHLLCFVSWETCQHQIRDDVDA